MAILLKHLCNQSMHLLAFLNSHFAVNYFGCVSQTLAVQDDPSASNGNKDSLGFDGMADVEVERRLKVRAFLKIWFLY